MPANLTESDVEEAALEWFGELGYAVGHGPHIAPGEPAAERDSFSEVVLLGRLRGYGLNVMVFKHGVLKSVLRKCGSFQ